jgi:hypothetical protein
MWGELVNVHLKECVGVQIGMQEGFDGDERLIDIIFLLWTLTMPKF